MLKETERRWLSISSTRSTLIRLLALFEEESEPDDKGMLAYLYPAAR